MYNSRTGVTHRSGQSGQASARARHVMAHPRSVSLLVARAPLGTVVPERARSTD